MKMKKYKLGDLVEVTRDINDFARQERYKKSMTT